MSEMVYLVTADAYEYNDEYWSWTDGVRFENKARTDLAQAEAHALLINMAHAREVVTSCHEWTYGEGVWHLVENCADAEELYRRVFRKEPGDDFKKELEALSELSDGLPEGEGFTDEDIRWFVENVSTCRRARVEALEVL
jgi:hypothetical protein